MPQGDPQLLTGSWLTDFAAATAAIGAYAALIDEVAQAIDRGESAA